MADNVVDIVVRTVDEATGELESIARGIGELGSSIADSLQGSVEQLSLSFIKDDLTDAKALTDAWGDAIVDVTSELNKVATIDTDLSLEPVTAGLVAARSQAQQLDGALTSSEVAAQDLADTIASIGSAINEVDASQLSLDLQNAVGAGSDAESQLAALSAEARNIDVKQVWADVQRLAQEINAAKGETEELDDATDSVKDGFEGVRDTVSSVKRALAGIGIGVGLTLLTRNIIQQEQATRKLDVVFRNMRGTIGLTRAELTDLAVELQATTIASRNQIEEAQALLATFDLVRGEAFERTITVANDLAVVMGTDIVQATRQVGLALQSPADGFGLLARAGVKLSGDLQRTVQRLVDLGRTSEAQSLLLSALESKVTGVSRAMRNTLGGALVALKTQLGDLLSGDSDLDRAANAVNNLTEQLRDPELQEGMDSLIAGFTTLFARIAEGVALFPRLSDEMLQLVPLGRTLQDALDIGRAAQKPTILQAINKDLEETIKLRGELESNRALTLIGPEGRAFAGANQQLGELDRQIAEVTAKEEKLRKARAAILTNSQFQKGPNTRPIVEGVDQATAALGDLSDGLSEVIVTAERLGDTGADALREIEDELRLAALPEIDRLIEEWKRAEAEIAAAELTPRTVSIPFEELQAKAKAARQTLAEALREIKVPVVPVASAEQAEQARRELTDQFLEPIEISVKKIELPEIPKAELTAAGQRAAENIHDAFATTLRGLGRESGRDIARAILESFRETIVQVGALKLSQLFGIDKLLAGDVPESGVGAGLAKVLGIEESPERRTVKEIRSESIPEAEQTVARVLGETTKPEAVAQPTPVEVTVDVPDEVAAALERTPEVTVNVPPAEAPPAPDVRVDVPPELTSALDRAGECCPTEALASLTERTTEIRDSVVEDTQRTETAVREVADVLRESTDTTDSDSTTDTLTNVTDAERQTETIADVLRESVSINSADESRSAERLERVIAESARTSTIERDASATDVAREVIRATGVERDSSATVENNREIVREPVAAVARDTELAEAIEREISATREVATAIERGTASTSEVRESTATVQGADSPESIATEVQSAVSSVADQLATTATSAQSDSREIAATLSEATVDSSTRVIDATRESASTISASVDRSADRITEVLRATSVDTSGISASLEEAVSQPEVLPFTATIDALADELAKNPILSKADPRDTAVALGTAPSETAAQLVSSVAPGIGDISGLLQDAAAFTTDEESRTAANFALSATGLLPLVPHVPIRGANQYTKYGREKVGPAAMSIEEARAAGYTEGPFYHSTDFAAEIEQGGFKQRAMDTWEIRDPSTMEEVRKWGTGLNPVMFSDRIEDVVETAAHDAFGKEVLTLFARPGSVKSADDLTLAGGRFVRDPAQVVPIRDSRQPARASVAAEINSTQTTDSEVASAVERIAESNTRAVETVGEASSAISRELAAISASTVERSSSNSDAVSSELAAEITRSVETATAETRASVERGLEQVAASVTESRDSVTESRDASTTSDATAEALRETETASRETAEAIRATTETSRETSAASRETSSAFRETTASSREMAESFRETSAALRESDRSRDTSSELAEAIRESSSQDTTATQQTVTSELASEISRSVEAATTDVRSSIERELEATASTASRETSEALRETSTASRETAAALRETTLAVRETRDDLTGSAPEPIPPRDEGPLPGAEPDLPDAEVAQAISTSTETTTATIERTSDESTATVAQAIRESTSQISEVIRENNQQAELVEQTREHEVREQGLTVSAVERTTVERGEQQAEGQALEEIQIDAQPIAEAMTQAVDKIPPVLDKALGALPRIFSESLGQLGGLITVAVTAIRGIAAGSGASSGFGGSGGLFGAIGTAIGALFLSEGGMVRAQGMADGGLVRGPGTGTSDSIPAVVRETGRRVRLSDKEFVEPADVVAQPGVLPALEALRKGTPLKDVAAAVLGVTGEAANDPVEIPTEGRRRDRTETGRLPRALAAGLATGGLVAPLLAAATSTAPGHEFSGVFPEPKRMATGGLVGSALSTAPPLRLASGGLVDSELGLALGGPVGRGLLSEARQSIVQEVTGGGALTFTNQPTYQIQITGAKDDDEMLGQLIAYIERRDADTESRILERMRVTGFGRMR